jgi:hypothetical protein
MNRSDFVQELHAARREWEATLAAVPEERMVEPALAGGWTVKDAVAHVAWSEHEMVGVIRQRALVGSPLWALDQDTRNAQILAENRDRPLDEVLADEEAIWAELLPGLESLADEDLVDPARFTHMEELPGVLPWQIFAGSTFRHHREHARDIAAWCADVV